MFTKRFKTCTIDRKPGPDNREWGIFIVRTQISSYLNVFLWLSHKKSNFSQYSIGLKELNSTVTFSCGSLCPISEYFMPEYEMERCAFVPTPGLRLGSFVFIFLTSFRQNNNASFMGQGNWGNLGTFCVRWTGALTILRAVSMPRPQFERQGLVRLPEVELTSAGARVWRNRATDECLATRPPLAGFNHWANTNVCAIYIDGPSGRETIEHRNIEEKQKLVANRHMRQ